MTNDLNKWAIKHGIPYTALQELRVMFGTVEDQPLGSTTQTGSEAAVQTDIRLEASSKGCRVWRNNVGATMTDDGSFIRYGLANDSKQMNDRVKSSDLIGIRPIVITEAHIGHTIGQFVAREVKRPDWKYMGTKREVAQLRFLELVMSLGGDGCFAVSEGTL